jgi:hypothetical protein
MSFGRAQVESEAQCPIKIGLKLANIGGEDQFCYQNGQLKFTLENGVNIDVVGLIVNVIGTQRAETFELNEAAMGKAGNFLGSVNYDLNSGGEIRQVKISPKIVLYDEEQICTDKAIVIEKIREC